MILGRVIGNVVCTEKAEALTGRKILIVRPVDAAGRACGRTLLALDAVQAGEGDTVLVLDEGNSSRLILEDSRAPVRTMIVGIVDAVSIDEAAAEHTDTR
jgi:microcompartment protein CcmK/EutM